VDHPTSVGVHLGSVEVSHNWEAHASGVSWAAVIAGAFVTQAKSAWIVSSQSSCRKHKAAVVDTGIELYLRQARIVEGNQASMGKTIQVVIEDLLLAVSFSSGGKSRLPHHFSTGYWRGRCQIVRPEEYLVVDLQAKFPGQLLVAPAEAIVCIPHGPRLQHTGWASSI
jgi:hypothetical protein